VLFILGYLVKRTIKLESISTKVFYDHIKETTIFQNCNWFCIVFGHFSILNIRYLLDLFITKLSYKLSLLVIRYATNDIIMESIQTLIKFIFTILVNKVLK